MSDLQYFSVPLSGGLNTTAGLTRLGNDFTIYAGFDGERPGILSSRAVKQVLISTTNINDAPTQLWTARTVSGGTAYLVIYTPGRGIVYTSSNLSTLNTLLTWTTTQKMMAADVLNGKVWMTNGVDTPQSWDMTTATTTVATVTAMPKGQHLVMYKNYCFVARTSGNPSRVFFSTLKDPTTWPTNNFQDVAPDDGDQITGLFATPEALMIFKQRTVWLMLGDAFDATNPQWRLLKLLTPEGVGGIGSTAAYLPGVGTLWVGRDNIYAWNGSVVTTVGDKIKETFTWAGINLYDTGYVANDDSGADWNSLKDAFGIVFRGRYWLSVMHTTLSGRNVFSMDDQGNWEMSRNVTTVQFAGWTVYSDTSYTKQLLVAEPRPNIGTGGDVSEWGIRRATGGTASKIGLSVATALTGLIDFGNPSRLKHLSRGFAVFSLNNSSATMSFTLTLLPNGSTTNQVVVTLSAANGTALGAAASFPNVSETTYRQDFEINLQVRFVQIQIVSAAASKTNSLMMIALQNLVLEYTTESVHGGATL